MTSKFYKEYSNNGKLPLGQYWSDGLVRHMRNAFIESCYYDPFVGKLHYQTDESNKWFCKDINCEDGQAFRRSIGGAFIPCTEEKFDEFTEDGFDLYLREIEDVQRLQNVSFLNNQFMYKDHNVMSLDEMICWSIEGNPFWDKDFSDYGLRSFLISVEGETEYFYRTTFLYLNNGAKEWKGKKKRFRKEKFHKAYKSRLIEETDEIMVSKYLLGSV